MHSIIFHAHQKLDRVAHKHLRQLDPPGWFPTIRQVLAFEAGYGPDGAKLKRQQVGGEQPWHFLDPYGPMDQDIYDLIKLHYKGLVWALAEKDEVRASFEAAWLAHALVDGLTPAHHYPYERELKKLWGGAGRNARKGLLGRLYVKGDNLSLSVQRSLKLVGPKGLLTSHAMFETGAYTLIAPLKLAAARPSKSEMDHIIKSGILEVFKENVKAIADLEIFERFQVRGWTQTLSQEVRRELAPCMTRMITLAWYSACREAAKA
jgi:hypothetical protein